MEIFASFLIIAFLAETIVQYLKPIWERKPPMDGSLDPFNERINLLIASSIGVAFAFAFNVDLFKALALNAAIPYVGPFFTGVLAGRGATAAHELIELLRNMKNAWFRRSRSI